MEHRLQLSDFSVGADGRRGDGHTIRIQRPKGTPRTHPAPEGVMFTGAARLAGPDGPTRVFAYLPPSRARRSLPRTQVAWESLGRLLRESVRIRWIVAASSAVATGLLINAWTPSAPAPSRSSPLR